MTFDLKRSQLFMYGMIAMTLLASCTPDTRTGFQKTTDASSFAPPAPRSAPTTASVRYEITGDRVNAVSLTWENNTGGTDQGDYKVPFKQTYRMDIGDFVYISAQIIQPTSNAGFIECRIFIDNEEVFYAKASSFASIATCSGSVPSS